MALVQMPTGLRYKPSDEQVIDYATRLPPYFEGGGGGVPAPAGGWAASVVNGETQFTAAAGPG